MTRLGLRVSVCDDDGELTHTYPKLPALARHSSPQAPVLLCDEVTSAIDLATDATIHSALLGLRSTLLVICHRLNHIHDFDHVIVMEQGRAIEAGAPAVLLEDKGSMLSKMVKTAEAQSGAVRTRETPVAAAAAAAAAGTF